MDTANHNISEIPGSAVKKTTIFKYLTRAIFLCAIPAVLVSLLLMFNHIRQINDEQYRADHLLVQDISNRIDGEISAHIKALEVLAGSPLLDSPPRLIEFYREMQTFLSVYCSHVILADLSRQMLLNTRVPLGEPLPRLPTPVKSDGRVGLKLAVETGKPVVGDIVFGPVAKEPLLNLTVPVKRGEAFVYGLINTFEVGRLEKFISSLNLPKGYTVTLRDGSGYELAMNQSERGGTTDSVQYVVKSDLTSWSILLSAPTSFHYVSLSQTVEILMIIFAVGLIATLLGARSIARKMSQSVISLTGMDVKPSSGTEFHEVEIARSRLLQANIARESLLSKLSQREEELRIFIEHAPCALAMFDDQMRYIAASSRWRKEYNLGDREIVSLSHYDISPETTGRWKEFHRKGLAGEIIREDEDRLERTDGSVQWLRWEIRPWPLPDKTVGGIVIFSEDITDYKLAAEASRNNEQRLTLAMEAAHSGYWEWNTINNKIYWSDELWSLYGLEPHCCDQTYETWISAVHPDDRDRLQKQIMEAVNNSTDLNTEWRVNDVSGRFRYLMSRARPAVDEQGQLSGYRGIVIDITDRKMIEDELFLHRNNLEKMVEERTAEVREIQVLLQTIIDYLPMAVTYLDAEGRFIFSNKTFRRWWVKSPEQISGKPAVEVLGEDSTHALDQIARAEAGHEQSEQIVHTFRDGVTRNLWTLIVPDGNPDGTLKGIIRIATDITQIKKSQAALEESEARLRSYFDAPLIGVSVNSVEKGWVEVNEFLCKMLGYSRQELMGMTWAELTHPDDIDADVNQFRRLLAGEIDTYFMEKRYVRKNGDSIWTNLSVGCVRNPDGSLRYTIAFIQDISERKRLQKALEDNIVFLETLLEAIPNPVWFKNAEGTFIGCNRAFQDFVGLSRDQIVWKTTYDVSPKDIADQCSQKDEELWANPGILVYESVLNHCDGTLHPAIFSKATFVDSAGKMAGQVGVIQDISERVKAEQEKEGLLNELFEAKKQASLGTLVGGIAHDFNNMLQIVIGYGEILMDDIKAGRADTKSLTAILQTAETASDLVRKFMALGQQSMVSPKPTDLNNKIKELEALILHLPGIDHLEMDLVNQPTVIKQDSDELGQVIMNLAMNASEAIVNGGQLRISTTKAILGEDFCKDHFGVSPGPHILLTLTDTGRGMEEMTLSRIFDPFFSTKERGNIKGMGLGLSVARGIVQQRGGFITVESELGKGSTFSVYFPEIQTPAAPSMPETAKCQVSRGTTVLIVEDSVLVSGLEETALNAASYRTIIAANGKEAVNIYRDRHHEIGLVIMDIIMPEMNGRDCLMELLKINPLVKVIVLSGYDPKAELSLEVKPHVISFIPKPCKMSRLVEVVQLVMEG